MTFPHGLPVPTEPRPERTAALPQEQPAAWPLICCAPPETQGQRRSRRETFTRLNSKYGCYLPLVRKKCCLITEETISHPQQFDQIMPQEFYPSKGSIISSSRACNISGTCLIIYHQRLQPGRQTYHIFNDMKSLGQWMGSIRAHCPLSLKNSHDLPDLGVKCDFYGSSLSHF